MRKCQSACRALKFTLLIWALYLRERATAETLNNVLSGLGNIDRPVVFPIHPRTTARMSESDYIYTAENAASITAYKDRPAEYSLIVASETTADSFADAIVDRFKDQQKHVSSITVNPKSKNETDATVDWWDELDARDIGDRVNVERQPAQTGTITTVASVIEGETWTWDADLDLLVFTFYLSPAAHYDGHTYP